MVARNVGSTNSEEQKAILNQTIGLSEGQHKTVCPLCIHERKKKQDKRKNKERTNHASSTNTTETKNKDHFTCTR